MTLSSCIHVFILAFVFVISACSLEPIVYHQDHYRGLTQPIIAAKPTASKTKKVPKQIGNYSATKLTGTYANSVAMHNFMTYMGLEYGFTQSYLKGLFSKVRHLQSVVKLETPPSKIKTSLIPSPGGWSRYRKKFLTARHIKNGIKFWRKNAQAIQKASATYKVNAEYIVAIIGVETFFGLNVGKTPTLDALTTLAFHTKRRRKLFTSELENFLLMTAEEGYNPRQVVGSWAGAMGLCQFMPSSFRRLGVDFDGDGRRNLWNPADAIGSVANYFSHSGWQFNQPVATKVQKTLGLKTIKLSTYSGNEFWHVYPNFEVIKKYNHSNYYAMAVHQLSQAIKQGYQQR